MSVIRTFTLRCDHTDCEETLTTGATTVAALRTKASSSFGWRRDKLNRDICPAHPKLKGSRK